MGCVQSLFKRAQSSGLSPSPTEEAAPKAPTGQEIHADEDFKSSVAEDKPPEEPESNDTSYGVEATAVRTLAASTGTVAILGTTAKVKEANESTDDLKQSPVEKTEHPVFKTEPQNETIEITVSHEVLNESSSDINSLAVDNAQEKEKGDFTTDNVVSAESLKKEEVQVIVVEVEKTKPSEERTDDKTETIKPNDQFTAAVSVEKEPVRIFDLPEKKDRVHEPKIVEEMSVKKDEKSEKISDLEEISNKTREFVLSLSIEKTNFKDEVSDQMREPIEKLASQEEEQITPEEGEITPLESNKVIPESEPVSPDISKTDEDNEISSEQLKTNSLSDMSLSEALNSEGEEAAREAAKAQELREMVESLSATANRVSFEYQLSEDSLKEFLRHDTNVGTSLQEPEPILLEPSKTAIIPDSLSKSNLEYEVTEIISQHSPEPTFQQSPEPIIQHYPDSSFQLSPEPDTKIQPGTLTIIESSDDTNSNSETSPKEKEPSMFEVKETLAISDQTMKFKKTENDMIEEKEKDDTELELENSKKITETAIQKSNKLLEEDVLTKEIETKQKDEIKETPALIETNQKDEIKETPALIETNQKDEIKETPALIETNQKDEIKETPALIETNQKDEFNEAPVEEKDSEVIAAATTIQAGFRSYQARKNLKENEAKKEYEQTAEEQNNSNLQEANTSIEPIIPLILETFDEKGQTEEQEKYLLVRSDSKTSEPDEATETPTIETTEESVKFVPESLIKIAQAEVDKICKDAEKATESLMTPPIMKDEDDMDEADIQEEDFPAPPDDLLTSETESKNGEVKDEQSSSGTHSTEPTMPLGNNLTEGDSSKTEDTTAPSLAESEMLKSADQSPSQQNDDLRLESSFTENINTEVALQRDSTEGEFTMEEDSTRDDDIPTKSHSEKADVEESLTGDEEKAATVIQAGYRGFQTRKRLRETSSTGSPEGEESEKDSSHHELVAEENSKKDKDESSSSHSSSTEKSEKEIYDSAKKIQAGVRGYLVRKKQKVQRDAAVTIQSHFRGFKTRQRLKQDSS